MTTEIVEYSKTEAALAELAQKYKGVLFDVTTAEGMKTARQGRAELKGYRTALEKTRVEIKAPALKRSQLIDTEARRITAALRDLEDPIDQQIIKEEDRKVAEKMAVVRAEEARVAAEEKAKKDAEEARMASERAEIARQQAALDLAKREAAASEKARLDAIEAQERAARMRIEEEGRKARLEREEADRQARLAREAEERKAKEIRDAEETRLKAERDRLDAERRVAEEAARKLRAEQEAKQREIQRKKDELLDARTMLASFVERFGHLNEFAGVVASIKGLKKAA